MSSRFLVLVCTLLLSAVSLPAQAPTTPDVIFEQLDRDLTKQLTDGRIIGGQVAVRRGGKLMHSRCLGVVAVESEHAVDQQTMFLIGSCSKPFASICVLSLIADPQTPIHLDDQIDRWLPAFGEAMVEGQGRVKRAPTVEELMSHRSGVYSQKVGMTEEQAHWIRNFDHTLEEGVDGIEKYNLIANPGERYAYSGAGYCVLGRVAELAAEQDIETILQQRLCKPLGLTRTSYFPARVFADEQIATGIGGQAAPHRLGSDHRFPLIGGSLYSTAEEMTQFGDAFVIQWNGKADRLQIPRRLVREMTRARTPQSGYGLGWLVIDQPGQSPRLMHGGALQSYRAWLGVNLETGVSVAGCWTLAQPQRNQDIPQMLHRVLRSL